IIVEDIKLWGIDKDPNALLVTRIRVNFLNLREKSDYSIHTSSKGFFLTEFDQKFDIIVGNPPWVRHEDLVSYGSNVEDSKDLIIKKLKLNTRIDKKSDYYIYFCLLALQLLKENGVLAFITSNAWLEVQYGKTLQDYLLEPKKGISFEIIYNSKEKLWRELGVNAVLLLAKKTKVKKDMASAFFTELWNYPIKIPIESLKAGLLREKEYRDEFYRTESVTTNELKKTHKWAGQFLRMDKKEREILKKLSLKGVPLSKIAKIKFGVKTGANAFFHLQKSDEKSYGKMVRVKNKLGWSGWIEKKYLVPLMKTPLIVQSHVIEPENAKDFLFYCLDEKKNIEEKAQDYINWGENAIVEVKQGRESGTRIKGFQNMKSLSNRKNWYSIPKYEVPYLLWCKSYHDRPGCLLNKAKAFPDQRFYSIYLKEEYVPLVFTYLNSSLVWAQMEVCGNTNMGYGVLDTNVYWLKSIRIPIEITEESKLNNRVIRLMKMLMEEPKRTSIQKQCKVRSEIDTFYSKHLDLTSKELDVIASIIRRNLNYRLKT
ncbi:MAG: Eco57I restriction-modification methylase domain-containing protein, partial [Candidatus Hodarchaeales archaeon]